MRQLLRKVFGGHPAAAGCAVVALMAAGLAASPARAQCGSPPDPRVNTAGYASWCSCMGGSYNYQTTACTGATGPRQPSGGTVRGGGGSWPAQHWYCRARASNGASGWGRYGDRAAAERSALLNCDSYARGRACRITSCSYIGGSPPADTASRSYSAPPPPVTAQPPANMSPPFGPFRQPTAICGSRKCLADQICGPTNKCYDPSRHFYCGKTLCVKGRNYPAGSACGKCGPEPSQAGRVAPLSPFPFASQTCSQCYHKLKNDIRFGFLTNRPPSYIVHAIAGYENCKQKASGACTAGDGFRTAVRGCASPSFNHEGSRACVSHALINDTEN